MDQNKAASGDVKVTLPDGSVREFDGPVTGADVAADIGPGLAKAALAVKIDGELKDLSTTIASDAGLAIVTNRDEEGLELLRHDCAHVHWDIQTSCRGTLIFGGEGLTRLALAAA